MMMIVGTVYNVTINLKGCHELSHTYLMSKILKIAQKRHNIKMSRICIQFKFKTKHKRDNRYTYN